MPRYRTCIALVPRLTVTTRDLEYVLLGSRSRFVIEVLLCWDLLLRVPSGFTLLLHTAVKRGASLTVSCLHSALRHRIVTHRAPGFCSFGRSRGFAHQPPSFQSAMAACACACCCSLSSLIRQGSQLARSWLGALSLVHLHSSI